MGNESFVQRILDEQADFARIMTRDECQRLMQAVDLTVEYYWEQDPDQRFTFLQCASHSAGMAGATPVLGKTFWQLGEYGADNGSEPVWDYYQGRFARHEPIHNLTVRQSNLLWGTYYYSISAKPRFDETGTFLGYCGVVRDVTALKQNADHAESLDLAAIGIGHVNAEGRFIYSNRKLCDMLGYTLDEILFLNVRQISHPDDVNLTNDACVELHSGRIESFKCEKRYIRKNGSIIWVGLTIGAKRDAHGGELYHVSIVEDISARKEAEARVQHLATHDYLTGLPNRALFNQLLRHALETARRYQRKFALLFIDLDSFKQVNDSLGHEAGDLLLKEMSARFSNCVRSSDAVARLGGDEFVVLVQEINTLEQVTTVACNILSAAMNPVAISGKFCQVTASVGISLYPANGEDEMTLMKHADSAMYLAKGTGKNNYQLFDASELSLAP